MNTPKRKSEDTPSAPTKILKTGTCKTLSGKSTLTYQIGGKSDSSIHLHISKNTGGGFFSQEWIAIDDIRAILDEHPEGTPVTSFMLAPIFSGKSVNTPGFVLSVLVHEKLLVPIKGKKRGHEPVEPEAFTAKLEKLMSSNVKPKGTVRKTTKRVPKKAPRKKATGRINKSSTV